MGLISPSMWNDDKFIDLGVHAQVLWCYLLTGPESTSIPGLLIHCYKSLAISLRQPEDVVKVAVEQLQSPGMIEIDERRRVVRVPKSPEYNKPSNPNVLLGWWRKWQAFPESHLKYTHLDSLRRSIEHREKLFTVWNQTFGPVQCKQGFTPASLDVSQQKLPLFDKRETVTQTVQETVTQTVSKPTYLVLDLETELDLGSGGAKPETVTQTVPQNGQVPRNSQRAKSTNGARLELEKRARRLWELQESLRGEIPGARPCDLTSVILERVVACLETSKATDEVAEHVLRVYHANAILDPDDSAQWFNGKTNWKVDNFQRASGMPIKTGSTSGHFMVTGLETYGKGDVDL